MTEENTQAPVEETEQKQVEEKKDSENEVKVIGQYDQSIYVGDRSGKISIISWALENHEKDCVYHFTVAKPSGDPIKLILDKDDLYNISTLAMNASEMLE